MKGGLFRKYFLTAAGLMLVFMLCLTIAFSVSAGNFLARDRRKILDKNCLAAADFYGSVSVDGSLDFPVFYSMLKISSDSGDCDMFVCDSSGNVICCTCEAYSQDGYCPHSERPVPTDALEGAGSGDGFFEVGTFGGAYKGSAYTAGRSLKNSAGETVGAVFAGVPASDLGELYASFLRMFVFAAILPLGVCLLLAYFASVRLTRPLKMMSEAARAMAEGDFSRRVPEGGNDEVGELAASFNEMSDALRRLESTRRSFVANVSHELKTPMTTIAGFIDGILDGTIPADRRDGYLRVVRDEVERLSRVVQSMLGLSRLESGEQAPNFTPTDLSELTVSVALMFEQKAVAKRLSVTGLDALEPVTAEVDPDLTHQVVYNLTDNAIKFADEGGEVRFSLKDTGDTALLFIRNTGRGIAEKDLPHVFERFYKSDFSRSGVKDSTGLGLYIVKSIVNIHGGKIAVRSRENEYTEFEVVLPKHHPAPRKGAAG